MLRHHVTCSAARGVFSLALCVAALPAFAQTAPRDSSRIPVLPTMLVSAPAPAAGAVTAAALTAGRTATPTAAKPAPAARTVAPHGRAGGTAVPERWEAITPQAVNAPPARLPLGPGSLGPSMLRAQVLLDRALFSPGMMDGRWGRNTEHAVFWFQSREGLPTTGWIDSATYARLAAVAGGPPELVRPYTLTPADVAGPFTPMPESIYDQARLPCSCYQSLAERLSESFHVAPEVLRRLNPGVRFDTLKAGQIVQVPAARDAGARPGEVAALEVSGPGSYVHALDAAGRILYHFPSTLGSSYDPSPQGDFTVARVDFDPEWHYQPKILASVPDDRPDAWIKPGPNNAVGLVWVSLSVAHYGIHGTRSPETIGYAQSAGCVRLTNWDAVFLARRLRPGTPVRFRGTRPAAPATPVLVRADTTHAAAPVPRLLGVPAQLRRDTARRDTAKRDSARAPTRPDTTRKPPRV